jgi:hypothetical protein
MKLTSTPSYQIWQGIINSLQTEAMHVHYLKNIKHQQQMAGAIGIAQAAMHEAGSVFSTQAAVDEGDPVESFRMQVDGKTVQGGFWKTTFKDGEHVQVIGEERNGVIHAVAVTKPDERIIWMQPHCERGTEAKRKSVLKNASIGSAVFYLLAPALAWLFNQPYGFWFMMTSCVVVLIWGVMVLWSWKDYMAFGREMNAVGSALGLPEPEKIDLFKSTKQAKLKGKPELPLGVYYY